MRYYSKSLFRVLIFLHLLIVVAAFGVLFILFSTHNFGFSLNDTGFIREFIKYTLFPCSVFILFLFFSIIFLFLQQYKNHRFGYLAIISIPMAIYIAYIFYQIFPVAYFINSAFGDSFWSGIQVGIFWLFIDAPLAVTFLTPFYVLGRLVKEDFFKKK
jgi:hypothetical protein